MPDHHEKGANLSPDLFVGLGLVGLVWIVLGLLGWSGLFLGLAR